ncbi:fasciclin domain-containing protein [Paucibacter sp. hw1]|uniref:Fasciclin domain-containing protein n=2 Tax=Roseateles koreensis TaxID=2987526 RepID=A0ABT5KPP3_9BURK|nr:fasciclin domain-containing protein [Roseateles koreensis]MDC8784415.1 fasciclin domain-containing protein [Roseateles koreensis]
MNAVRRNLALYSSILLIAGLSACATTPVPPAPTTLAETLARQSQLSTFNRLIEQAGLRDSLNGAGPLTVLAPSDDAFKAVPAQALDALSQNPAQLKAVLNYHIFQGKMLGSDFQNGTVKTLNGATIATARAGTFLTVEDAVVQQTDLVATNGVAHVIDRVLMPAKK